MTGAGTRELLHELVDDALWEAVSPLLPAQSLSPSPVGRKRLNERQVFAGIVYILWSGLPWEKLPQEIGCGSGMTCWRRARSWQKAGVWNDLHRVLKGSMQDADRLDFSRVIPGAEPSHVRSGRRKPAKTRLIGR